MFTKILSKVKLKYLVLGIVLVGLGVYGTCATMRNYQLEGDLKEAISSLQGVELDKANWHSVESGKIEDSLTPSLKMEIETARKVETKPLVGVRATTKEVVVTLAPPVSLIESPTVSTSNPIGEPPLNLNSSNRSTFDIPPLSFQGDLQLRVDALANSSLKWTGTMFVKYRYTTPHGGGGWHSPIELPFDEDKTQFVVDPHLLKALRYYDNLPPRVAFRPRPLGHWRMGMIAGAGLGYTPDGVHPVVMVGWGIQF